MKRKFKPCPFCGNKKISFYTYSAQQCLFLSCQCDYCGVKLKGERVEKAKDENDFWDLNDFIAEKVVEKWNSRYVFQSSDHNEDSAELKAMRVMYHAIKTEHDSIMEKLDNIEQRL